MDSTIEEAKTHTSTGAIAKTISYYAAFVALGLAAATLGPTLPGLAENTGTQLGEIGFLFTARGLGYLLGSLLAGRLYDRRAGHPLMAGVLGVMAGTLALAPLVPLLWLLTLVLLALGVAEGVLDVGGNTLLVWVHREKVGPFMNALHFFFGAGAFLSPIIIAQAVLLSDDITWAYWILALIMLPVAANVLRLPSPLHPSAAKDSPAPRVNHLLVGLIGVFFFLYVGAEISFGGWVFTFATFQGLGNATRAAYLTSVFWGALTLGRLLSIPLAVRFRPRTILLADLLGCVASLAVILAGPRTFLTLLVGALGLGLFMASVFPTTLSLAERRMTITGQVTSLFFVGASSGGMFLPWLFGQLFEGLGPQAGMAALLVDLILALGVFAAINAVAPHERK